MDNYNFFKCNQRGKGFRIYNKTVTTFEERVLFLQCSNNNETDVNENTTAPEVGTSRNGEENRSITSTLSASCNKRKVDGNAEDEESTKRSKISIKGIKGESNDANISTGGEGKTSVEDELFSNDLLLRTIFANLKVEDLKSSRQVNSLWNLEATKILLKRDCLLPIQLSEAMVTIHDSAEHKLPSSLHEFRNIFTNSKLFPSTSFAVSSDKLSTSELDYFRKNGHLVKSFCFDPEYSGTVGEEDTTAGDIILLAAGCFPNLTKLRFVDAYEEPTAPLTLLAIEYVPDLKNLHTLELIGSFPADIISLILSKSSNLKNIYLHTGENENPEYIDHLDKLIKLENVIPRLRNICLIFFGRTLEIYQQVLKQEPRFSTIELDTVDRSFKSSDRLNVGRFLTALFHQCSESLTEILGLKCIEKVLGVNFPVFPNVKRLEIRLQPLSSVANLARCFPNLTTVEFDFKHFDEPEEIPPESMSPLLSVRHFQVMYEERWIPDNWVKTICSFCPNVISAKFCNPIYDSAYEYVWKLSKLQDLFLVIRPRQQSYYEFFELDSAFTGLSIEIAKQLYERIDADNFVLSAEEIQASRIKPSIVDLKELRKLSLRLFDVSVREEDSYVCDVYGEEDDFGQKNAEVIFDPGDDKALLKVDGEIILSCISKRFGFDLCPRLQSNVSVGFTHYTKLESESNGNEDAESLANGNDGSSDDEDSESNGSEDYVSSDNQIAE